MSKVHYVAQCYDSGWYHQCGHEHSTVISAANCISLAGSYVVAVQGGEKRALTNAEEVKFQHAMFGTPLPAKRRRMGFSIKVRATVVRRLLA